MGYTSNSQKPRGRRTSIYKGVYRHAARKKWMAVIISNGRSHWLGQFESEEDAARAYDQAAKELFGEFAYLNFPEPTMSVEDEEF
jgi:AP2-like factor, euAP2 lineage